MTLVYLTDLIIIFTQSPVNQSSTVNSPTDIPPIYSISILPEEVYHCLSSLDASKAAGIDGTGPRVLKQCAGSITPLVYHLFNLCISSYSLPEEWRLHLIVPVHKSGHKTDIKKIIAQFLYFVSSPKLWKS